jgi:hypothetical protein
VALGDIDGALAEVQMASQNRNPWFFQMLTDPRLRPVHERPEFQSIKAVLDTMEAAVVESQEPD